MPEPKKKKAYHHGALREEAARKALKTVRRAGSEGLNLRQLAAEMGVTHVALYRHFKDKKTLVIELARQGFSSLVEDIQRSVDRRRDPLAALKSFAETYLAFAVSEPKLFSIMFAPDMSKAIRQKPVGEITHRFVLLLKDTITRCLEKGYFKGQSRDAIAFTLWSLAHGVSCLALQKQIPPAFSPEEMGKLVFATWFKSAG